MFDKKKIFMGCFKKTGINYLAESLGLSEQSSKQIETKTSKLPRSFGLITD